MIRKTPNFTYEQHLACPVCGSMLQKRYELGKDGVRKRIFPKVRRPQKDGPWAPDDVLEDQVRKVGRYQREVTGRVWVHTASLLCSGCGIALSPGNGVEHEFADEELPHDFWERPEGRYAEEAPPEGQPALDLDDEVWGAPKASIDDLWADIPY